MPTQKQSPYGSALLSILQDSPTFVLGLLDLQQVLGSSDPHVVVAYALALTRTKQTQPAFAVWQHLLTLTPNDVEVACAVADAAIDNAASGVAVQALELCFALDVPAATPAGRRARVLAIKLDKLLASKR